MWLEKYVKAVGVTSDFPKFDGKEEIEVNLHTTDLFLAQCFNNYFNAIDIAVKYLAIECYYGKNNFGLELYRKMQLKRINEDWNERYVELIKSFENGIDMNSKIQVDLNYSIHDGAHRLALALYHGCKEVPVKVFNVEVQRRDYGINWFESNGFSEEELILIYNKLNELLEKCRKPYICILWPPARYLYSDIENTIENVENGVHIVERIPLTFTRESLKKFIYAVYETDDIQRYKLDLKYEHIMRSLETDKYSDQYYTIHIIRVKIDNPDFRLKPLSGLPQSKTTMRIKKKIREMFKADVTDYYYDIIMHLTDNQLQNDAVEEIISKIQKSAN